MDNHKISGYESDLILSTLQALDSSRSLAVAILFRYGEFQQIVNLGFNPFDYNDFATARDSLLATEFLRKHADLPTGIDLDEPCERSFLESESRCRVVNDLFLSGEFLPHYDVLLRARRKIEQILGDFTADEFLDLCSWGPGSTLRIPRRDSTFANKFRCESEVTLASYSFLKTWFSAQFPNWAPKFRIFEGSKIITVPKNAKTNRLIAVEPSLNLFFQKGVGSMIRKRLKRYNVDLDDQGRNQRLCLKASLSSDLATVDFSAASDSIAYGLVEFLLPDRWFKLLCKLRCERGMINGSFVQLEKFSSMGNGFTFELESLIFYAIAKSVVPPDDANYGDVSIYGDDLVAPSRYKDTLLSVFSTCGFSINQSKTYFCGYYRESCGFHFWNGVRICPFYLRSSMSDLQSCVKLHNQITRSYWVHFGCWGLSRLCSVILNLRNKCFREKVPYVPGHFGDQGLVVPWDVATPSVSQYGYGWVVDILIPKKTKSLEDDAAYFLEKLLHLHLGRDVAHRSDDLPGGNTRFRAHNTVFVRKRTWTADWPCLSQYFNMR